MAGSFACEGGKWLWRGGDGEGNVPRAFSSLAVCSHAFASREEM